jgi:cytoskeletal protein RodZ
MKKKIIIIIIFLIIIVIIGVFLYIKYKKPIAPSIKTTNKKPKNPNTPKTPRTPNSEYNDDSSYEDDSVYDDAQLIVDEAGAKMNEILSENEVRIKNLLKNRETRVCGANNIAPCDGNNSIEQSTTDPYYLTSQDPRFEKPVQCCVVNPNRNDPSKIQSAIKLATDIIDV